MGRRGWCWSTSAVPVDLDELLATYLRTVIRDGGVDEDHRVVVDAGNLAATFSPEQLMSSG